MKPQIKDSLLLIATHLNYEKVSKILTISASKTAYNLTLKEKSFNLEEIVIEIQKIKDTMAIKTDSLKLTERSTLRDILNKTEGFVVSEDGGITFRGKIIHKVLINKKEVFVNQNKIALDNLEYDMMNDIELINNYRDQYKIDFENFTETVINVNTRDEFKGIFKPSVEGAYGVKNKYQLNFRGLYFSDYLNAFITSNTNNIGKKSFSFTNISEEIKEQSSEFFKDHFTDFFAEDDLLAESFTSNSSITLRKENKKSRLGIVLYYNNLNQKKNTTSEIDDSTTLLNKRELESLQKGNSFLSNMSYYRALSKKAILSFHSNITYLEDRDKDRSTVLNFYPTMDTITEDNRNNAISLLNISKLELQARLHQRIILSSILEYDLEHSKNNFNSNYSINSNGDNLRQEYDFNNLYLKANSIMDYKFSNMLTASLGFKIKTFNENLNYKNDTERKGGYYQGLLSFRGQNKKWEYNIEFLPQTIRVRNKDLKENKGTLDVYINSDWNLNENSTIVMSYTQANALTEINYAIDSLTVSYNTRFLNTDDILNNISRFNQFSIGYNYSSIIKTQSFRTSYSYGEQRDYLEPIFQIIEQNIFYYQNRLIEKKRSSKYSVALGKGFYFSKKYHLLRFNSDFSAKFDKFPTFTPEERMYNVDQYQYGFSTGIEPKGIFFDELYLKMSINHQHLFLGNQVLNNNKRYTYGGTISKKKDKLEAKISIGQNIFKNEDFKFKSPFMSIEATVKLNKKMSVFLRGNYLFHLFNFPNTDLTSLSVKSDGNLIQSNYNENSLNYLIIGTSYKF